MPVLRRSQAWRHVFETLDSRGLVGATLPLECPRHPGVALTLGERCGHVCGATLACGHTCWAPCHRDGLHPPCEEIVWDTFPRCSHKVSRPCRVPLAEMSCRHPVEFRHDACGHKGTRLCYQGAPKCRVAVAVKCKRCGQSGEAECQRHREKPEEYVCRHPCTRKMSCGHPCRLQCSQPCDDGLDDCEVCEAKRAEATARRRREIDEHLEALGREDHVDFSEASPSQLAEVQQRVAAYFAGSDLTPTVTQASLITNVKLERRFCAASQLCKVLEAPALHLLPCASELEAKTSAQKGLKGKHVDFRLAAADKTAASIFLLCRVQLGRVYEHGANGHRAPFTQPPPDGFDSGYDEKAKCHRLWASSRAMPVYIVHVDARATACVPSHWSGEPAPAQGWSAIPICDLKVRDTLQACLATDGSMLGMGRDVVEAGRYTRLELVHAWRIENRGLWQRYTTERNTISEQVRARRLDIPRVAVRSELEKATGLLPDRLAAEVNEVRLLHGSKPDTILAILSDGLNERFSGGLFGSGSYLAEDPGKTDQYVVQDSHYGQAPELHKRVSVAQSSTRTHRCTTSSSAGRCLGDACALGMAALLSRGVPCSRQKTVGSSRLSQECRPRSTTTRCWWSLVGPSTGTGSSSSSTTPGFTPSI